MTALAGTTSDRNTATSSRNDTASTTPISQGSRSAIWSEKSIVPAVRPPMSTRVPVPAMASGPSRSRCTRRLVASACGEVVGKTDMTAASPFGLTAGVVTVATPGSVARVARSRWRSATPAGPDRSAASSRGPLNPGPKPWASRS